MHIPPEVRRAVYDEDCKQYGHMYMFSSLDESPSSTPDHPVNIEDDLKFPYVTCARCHRVWIIMPLSGVDYDDAERVLFDKLNPKSELVRRIARMRGKRADRNPPGRAVH